MLITYFKDESNKLRDTTLIHLLLAETDLCKYGFFINRYSGAITGAPVAAYTRSVVGARLRDHVQPYSLYPFPPAGALCDMPYDLLFSSLPLVLYSVVFVKLWLILHHKIWYVNTFLHKLLYHTLLSLRARRHVSRCTQNVIKQHFGASKPWISCKNHMKHHAEQRVPLYRV